MSMTPDEKPLVQQFQDDLNVVIDRFRDEGLSLAEAVGTLEIVKMDLWTQGTKDEEV